VLSYTTSAGVALRLPRCGSKPQSVRGVEPQGDYRQHYVDELEKA